MINKIEKIKGFYLILCLIIQNKITEYLINTSVLHFFNYIWKYLENIIKEVNKILDYLHIDAINLINSLKNYNIYQLFSLLKILRFKYTKEISIF
jgi:hypothetical protein